MAPSLDTWERQAIHPVSAEPPRGTVNHDFHRRIIAVEPPGPPIPGGPFERARRAIMAYDIFPPNLATGVVRLAPVRLGDTVGMRYRLLPGLRLFFASRVTAVTDIAEPPLFQAGFTYQTLQEHPELGEEAFGVEKVAHSGEVRVYLKAWSRPGHWLARLFSPLARHLQLQAGRAALDHLEKSCGRCE